MHPLHVIGSSGFIGKSLQRHDLTGNLVLWSHRFNTNATENYFDLLNFKTWDSLCASKPKNVLLLSWPGLPNYQGEFHLTKNLTQSINLIDRLIDAGCESLTVAGTCYEYGLKSGSLKETDPAEPVNMYGIAKDALRRFVAIKCSRAGVKWTWLRIFYPYGEGQNPKSLYPSLVKAINQKSEFFPMSSGKQIRDFVSAHYLAKCILQLASSGCQNEIVNLGSGTPMSLKDFATSVINSASSNIQLKLGEYQDRNDEPFAFWADTSKLNSILSLQ